MKNGCRFSAFEFPYVSLFSFSLFLGGTIMIIDENFYIDLFFFGCRLSEQRRLVLLGNMVSAKKCCQIRYFHLQGMYVYLSHHCI